VSSDARPVTGARDARRRCEAQYQLTLTERSCDFRKRGAGPSAIAATSIAGSPDVQRLLLYGAAWYIIGDTLVSRDLVFRGPVGTIMATDPSTEVSQEPVVSCDTAFSCLLRLGADVQVGAVRSRSVVDGDTLSVARLVELAGELGLKAEPARLNWQAVQTIGLDRPILALLKNG